MTDIKRLTWIDTFQRGQDLFYYHRDEQLSTAFIIGAEGEIQNSYLYDAFGAELEAKEQFQNRIRYTGQQYDDLTGQYYLRARYYNPILGRFMQEDVCQGDGLNLYVYCGNNPVVYYDPSGYTETSQQPGNGCPPDAQFSKDDNTDNDDEPATHTYYTVQNESDAERLCGDGTPWPTEGTRANLGEGVYAWGNMDDAQNYLERKQGRTSEPLSILQFNVNDNDLSNMKTLDTRNMSDAQRESFFGQYGVLYGGEPNHGYDYIINNANLGVEHYFNITVFDKLHFEGRQINGKICIYIDER